jgi:hypothetical protein
MDEHTRQNWQKIKEVLEESGKTDCFFYKRACSILTTGKDLFNDYKNQLDSI